MTILVGGEQVVTGSVGAETESLLFQLLAHPVLVESASALKGVAVRGIRAPQPSGNEDFDPRAPAGGAEVESSYPKFVYIFQKEFATASPLFAEWIGTDEITTCLGLVIRDPSSGLTSVGHFDDAKCVLNGVNDLINSVISLSSEAFQVHLVGAFDDSCEYDDQAAPTLQPFSDGGAMEEDGVNKRQGWSWPLVLKMVETLQNSAYDFEVETCCILNHNTSIGPNGHPMPTIRGFVVETSSGRLLPSTFELEARGPDGTVRGVGTTTVSENEKWVATLISPYETLSDTFVLHPFKWSVTFERYAKYMLTLSDEIFLETFSTSPHAEGPTFLTANRRIFTYMRNFPDWEQTFPNSDPRVWTRTRSGGWARK